MQLIYTLDSYNKETDVRVTGHELTQICYPYTGVKHSFKVKNNIYSIIVVYDMIEIYVQILKTKRVLHSNLHLVYIGYHHI